MKKIIVALTALLTLNTATLLAAPVNDLATGQTAIGAGNSTFYVEHKLADNFTLGYQNVDRDEYGKMDDIYGQYQFTDNLRGIIGSRNFDSTAKTYLGIAVNTPLSSSATGYASLITGSEFKEVEVGTNINLARNVDLNLGYHSFMPDQGRNNTGVGVGASFKF
ncbi:MAG: hypothetical protein ABFC84_14415 [Veillonellales bacterium]